MRKNFVFFGIAFLVVFLDQLTKYLVSSALSFSESVSLLGDFLRFTLVRNYGIGFGLLGTPALRWLWILITTAIIIGILFYYKDIPKKYFPCICWALVLGGALGNLIDRVLLGFVVDFIDFGFWPAFNVADSAITVGVILLIIYSWQSKRQ